MNQAIIELISRIKNSSVKTQKQLENEKIAVARKYKMHRIIKNAEVLNILSENDYDKFSGILRTKSVRTASGVANIAVMWLPDNPKDSCPANCIYCPQGLRNNINVPKSYTGTEPTTMRAIRNDFDPYKQVKNRLHHFYILGQNTDKCELIVMGGTYTSWDTKNQRFFIKRCLDAFNGCESEGLDDAKTFNETARNRVIGITFETRADFCTEKHIREMLEMGCTRVEIGVQSTSDELLKKIRRGHLAKDNADAIARLKKAGLKACIHWMPGLTGLDSKDMEREVEMFEKLFSDKSYRPDELKIYPTLVIEGTELYEKWKKGEYDPLSINEMETLLKKLKSIIPPYVRVKRIMRDISEKEVSAGPATTNLRQLVNANCQCIRCREIGIRKKMPENIKLQQLEYEASGGLEIFLSFEGNGLLVGFLRLRLDDDACAKIRELHVYGTMVPINSDKKYTAQTDKIEGHFWCLPQMQSRGFGKRLLEEAEKIASMHGKKSVRVTSGIGAREYYKKLGYSLNGYYMEKKLGSIIEGS